MQALTVIAFRRWGAGVVIVTGLLLPSNAQAAHIIGGDVQMRAVGTTPDLFRLRLNQYWDETKTSTGNRDQSVRLLVYRKQNPVLIESIQLPLRETLPLVFDNEACAKLRKLTFTEARYAITHPFDPSLYTDPGGYYMVWERCCRNDELTNVDVRVAAGVAMVFYLEFPPMIRNGAAFRNSAPDFGLPNGDYICINKPFTFNVGATDADSDQLRYSLVTPLNGYATRTAPTTTTTAAREAYPTIVWKPGYSLTNAIPGDPPLRIDPGTGVISVRASQEGLFLFTVQCEEFRNGERLGVVRRDFQLPVIDCSRNTPPPAVVTANGKADREITWCANQPLVLAVEKNPIWAYQWQKDGNNLRGATADTLRVRESGVYTVVKSQAKACGNDTTSQGVMVTLVVPPPVSLSAAGNPPYCAGDTVTLRATEPSGYQYAWRRDGSDLPGEQQATLRVYQSGQYVVGVREAAGVCEGRDTLAVTINARPTAQLTASTRAFCPGDAVQLVAATAGGYRYRWQQNSTRLTNADTTSRLTTRQAGTYRVTVTGPTGCTAVSEPLTLTQYDSPAGQLDSVAPTCATTSPPVLLRGQPAGGTYAGVGVTGDRFDPAVAGVGRHKVTYTISSDQGCRTAIDRWAAVSPGPKLDVQPVYTIYKGNSVQLLTNAQEPVLRYRWESPASLSRPDIASPVASPAETTPYQLTAVGQTGCETILTVRVEVVEPLSIPSAFSPNGDGLNDAWVISSLGSFSQCEVTVYNRWGEIVFYSRGYDQPWDGAHRQERVRPGVYTYQIRVATGSLTSTYRGQLLVIY